MTAIGAGLLSVGFSDVGVTEVRLARSIAATPPFSTFASLVASFVVSSGA
jgi:hypothetical protein